MAHLGGLCGFEVMPVLNEGDERMSLGDLVAIQDTCLTEQQLWATCHECCVALQSLHWTSDLFQMLTISPDTLAFDNTGAICFLEPYNEPEAIYVPPEIETIETVGNSHKSHLYSLGMTLMFAAEYNVCEEGGRTLDPELDLLISQMMNADADCRIPVEEVLQRCDGWLGGANSTLICGRLVASVRIETPVPDGRLSSTYSIRTPVGGSLYSDAESAAPTPVPGSGTVSPVWVLEESVSQQEPASVPAPPDQPGVEATQKASKPDSAESASDGNSTPEVDAEYEALLCDFKARNPPAIRIHLGAGSPDYATDQDGCESDHTDCAESPVDIELVDATVKDTVISETLEEFLEDESTLVVREPSEEPVVDEPDELTPDLGENNNPDIRCDAPETVVLEPITIDADLSDRSSPESVGCSNDGDLDAAPLSIKDKLISRERNSQKLRSKFSPRYRTANTSLRITDLGESFIYSSTPNKLSAGEKFSLVPISGSPPDLGDPSFIAADCERGGYKPEHGYATVGAKSQSDTETVDFENIREQSPRSVLPPSATLSDDNTYVVLDKYSPFCGEVPVLVSPADSPNYLSPPPQFANMGSVLDKVTQKGAEKRVPSDQRVGTRGDDDGPVRVDSTGAAHNGVISAAKESSGVGFTGVERARPGGEGERGGVVGESASDPSDAVLQIGVTPGTRMAAPALSPRSPSNSSAPELLPPPHNHHQTALVAAEDSSLGQNGHIRTEKPVRSESIGYNTDVSGSQQEGRDAANSGSNTEVIVSGDLNDRMPVVSGQTSGLQATDPEQIQHGSKASCEGLTVQEVLDKLGCALHEAELWGLCRQALLTLRALHPHLPAYVSLETVQVEGSGAVIFCPVQEDQDLEVVFLSPELQMYGIITEKTCLFGLAAMLWSAADFRVPVHQEPVLSDHLENLLVAMTQDDSGMRPDLAYVLEECDQYHLSHSLNSRDTCKMMVTDATKATVYGRDNMLLRDILDQEQQRNAQTNHASLLDSIRQGQINLKPAGERELAPTPLNVTLHSRLMLEIRSPLHRLRKSSRPRMMPVSVIFHNNPDLMNNLDHVTGKQRHLASEAVTTCCASDSAGGAVCQQNTSAFKVVRQNFEASFECNGSEPSATVPNAFKSSLTHFSPIVLSPESQKLAVKITTKTPPKDTVSPRANINEEAVAKKMKELKKNLMKNRPPLNLAQDLENDLRNEETGEIRQEHVSPSSGEQTEKARREQRELLDNSLDVDHARIKLQPLGARSPLLVKLDALRTKHKSVSKPEHDLSPQQPLSLPLPTQDSPGLKMGGVGLGYGGVQLTPPVVPPGTVPMAQMAGMSPHLLMQGGMPGYPYPVISPMTGMMPQFQLQFQQDPRTGLFQMVPVPVPQVPVAGANSSPAVSHSSSPFLTPMVNTHHMSTISPHSNHSASPHVNQVVGSHGNQQISPRDNQTISPFDNDTGSSMHRKGHASNQNQDDDKSSERRRYAKHQNKAERHDSRAQKFRARSEGSCTDLSLQENQKNNINDNCVTNVQPPPKPKRKSKQKTNTSPNNRIVESRTEDSSGVNQISPQNENSINSMDNTNASQNQNRDEDTSSALWRASSAELMRHLQERSELAARDRHKTRSSKLKRAKSGSSIDFACTDFRTMDIYEESVDFLESTQKKARHKPRRRKSLSLAKSQPNLDHISENHENLEAERNHRHAQRLRKHSYGHTSPDGLLSSTPSSPSWSKDSGVSGLTGGLVMRGAGDVSLMERLLNSDTLRHQQRLSAVIKLLRDEFAYDGYMENGVEDLAMAEYVLSLGSLSSDTFRRAVTEKYQDLFWQEDLLAAMYDAVNPNDHKQSWPENRRAERRVIDQKSKRHSLDVGGLLQQNAQPSALLHDDSTYHSAFHPVKLRDDLSNSRSIQDIVHPKAQKALPEPGVRERRRQTREAQRNDSSSSSSDESLVAHVSQTGPPTADLTTDLTKQSLSDTMLETTLREEHTYVLVDSGGSDEREEKEVEIPQSKKLSPGPRIIMVQSQNNISDIEEDNVFEKSQSVSNLSSDVNKNFTVASNDFSANPAFKSKSLHDLKIYESDVSSVTCREYRLICQSEVSSDGTRTPLGFAVPYRHNSVSSEAMLNHRGFSSSSTDQADEMTERSEPGPSATTGLIAGVFFNADQELQVLPDPTIYVSQQLSGESSLASRIAAVEQQIVVETRNHRKTLRYYHRLLEAASSPKGDQKALVGRLWGEVTESSQRLGLLQAAYQYLQVELWEEQSVPHELLYALACCPGDQTLLLSPSDNPLVSFLSVPQPGSAENVYTLHAGTPHGLLTFLFAEDALAVGFVHQFFFCYRYFVSSNDVLQFLMDKFHAALLSLTPDADTPLKVKTRSLWLLRIWIEGFYSVDFKHNTELLNVLRNFLRDRVEPVDRQGADLCMLLEACCQGRHRDLRYLGPASDCSGSFRDASLAIIHQVAAPGKKLGHGTSYHEWETMKAALHLSARPQPLRVPQRSVSMATCLDRKPGRSLTVTTADAYLPTPGTRSSDAFALSDYTPHSLAQQLTMLEQNLFSQCHPVHFLNSKAQGVGVGMAAPVMNRAQSMSMLNCAWEDHQESNLFAGSHYVDDIIQRLIDHAQSITFWVAAEIVTCSSAKTQVAVLSKFIYTARICEELHNFATCVAIVDGLENILIRQLPSWRNVPAKCTTIMEELTALKMRLKSDSGYLMSDTSSRSQPIIPSILLFLFHVQQLEIGGFTLANGMFRWPKLKSICSLSDQIRICQGSAYQFDVDMTLQRQLMQRVREFGQHDLQNLASQQNYNMQKISTKGTTRIGGALKRMKARLKGKD